MPSIDRRQFAQATAGGLLCLLAGCTGTGPETAPTSTETATPTPTRTPTHTGTYGDFTEGPESYPDRPTELSEATARAYVHDAEHARTYNRLYEPDVTELSVECRTVYDTESGGGHYVLATCTGYANYPDVHADWGQYPALYFVSPDVAVRVGDYDSQGVHCTKVFASEDPSENFAEECDGDDAAYRVYNSHPESHTVSVDVEFLGEDGTGGRNRAETVLEREYILAPTAGVEQRRVTRRTGVYRLTATLGSGVEATYRWELASEPTYQDPPVTVLVTPAGGLTIRTVPFHEV